MFALFYSLYLAMFRGSWTLFDNSQISSNLTQFTNGLGTFLTSIFNNVDTPMTNLGDILFVRDGNGILIWQGGLSFILALITSIGIVVMAVKGVKKAFGIFFGQIR